MYNYAISSYTPTLSALIAARRKSLNTDAKNPRVAVIAQPDTQGESPLKGAYGEVETIQAFAPKASNRYSILYTSGPAEIEYVLFMGPTGYVRRFCPAGAYG